MNLHRRYAALALACLLVACEADDPAGPNLVEQGPPIDIPSSDELCFAEGRDFTVVGYFEPPLSQPGDIRVELFAGYDTSATPVRVVRSHVDPATGITPRASLNFSYAKGVAWGPEGLVNDPEVMVMTPDLVATPGGLADPTNKVVVTNEYYAAVVLGGVTRDFDTLYEDAEGSPWDDLTAGVYTLRVTGESGDLAGRTQLRRVEFGLTDAMLGRFAPLYHKERLLEEAASRGLRTYTDFFPGFFSHDGYSYEIVGRWMPNNSIEVVNDLPTAIRDGVDVARNDVLLYNISESSATNRIEIGAIASHDLIDSERTTFRYYQLGEPMLSYVDRRSQRATALESEIQAMAPLDRLVLTRLELEPEGREPSEGSYDIIEARTVEMVTNLSSTVLVDDGEMFSVFGVASPIPTATTVGTLPAQYEMENGIAGIRYRFLDRSSPGPAVREELRQMGLSRRYDPTGAPDAFAHSIYEFEHEFQPSLIGLPAGRYLVQMQCLDEFGAPVPGGAESLLITIADPPR